MSISADSEWLRSERKLGVGGFGGSSEECSSRGSDFIIIFIVSVGLVCSVGGWFSLTSRLFVCINAYFSVTLSR